MSSSGPIRTPGRPRVLVVDDDESTRTVVQWQLGDAGFDVAEAADGQGALAFLAAETPLLMILDLSLPAIGGLDVLREIRTGAARVPVDLPVIILSGRSGETDRIIGLDLGADDYLVKPFSPGELAARVRSLLRRAGASEAGERLDAGPVSVDVASREVLVDGSPVPLTAKEFDLLTHFVRHPRQVFTRPQLLETVWQSPGWLGEATVTEHVHRLRTKLGRATTVPLIRTVHGVGYQFDSVAPR